MQKILFFLVLSFSSLFFATAIAKPASSGSSLAISGSTIATSGSSARYKGVDERNNLNMFKIAILPFDAKGAEISAHISSKQLQTGLNQVIIAQITQSRKLRVANRDVEDEGVYEKEVRRIINSDSADEREKLNQKIGVDFILTGDILGLNISKKKASYYGEDFTTWKVSASVAYRMVELATMEVKWSNVVTINVPKNIANEYLDSDDGSYSQILNYLGEQFGRVIANQIVGAIYPLQVLKVDDGIIYFNQGGNRVLKGNVYEIRQDGGVTVDDATGQHIVLDSKVLAKVRITDVMPKYSMGVVISGSLSKIKKNSRAYLTK